MTRRDALKVVGVSVAYLHGVPVTASQVASQQSSRGLSLVLDGLDGIILQYRGQRVVIQPAEIMAALAPDVATPLRK